MLIDLGCGAYSKLASVPEGFTAVSSQAKSAFNVEELDDDKELWLIRLPNNVSKKCQQCLINCSQSSCVVWTGSL